MIHHHFRTVNEGPRQTLSSFGGVSKEEAAALLFGPDGAGAPFTGADDDLLAKAHMTGATAVGAFPIDYVEEVLGENFMRRLREVHIKAGIPNADVVLIDTGALNRVASGKAVLPDSKPAHWEAPIER